MKRKKRKGKSKADIITGILYGVFGLLVFGVLYGLGSLAYTLMGATVGNHYYASLAEQRASADTVDFAKLTAENPEIRAWVRLTDTAIDLPVVQTTDNSFYLTHRFDEKKNKLGTPFVDAGNAGDFSDRHTVIYGHALSSGAMFGSLWEYENPNYFTRHPQIQLFLADGRQLTLAVFACSRVNGVRSAIPIAFADEAAFLSFVEGLKSTSAFTSSVEVKPSDRIVSFCVVLPDGGDGRMLVSCKAMDGGAVTTLTSGDTQITPIDLTGESPAETPAN